MLNQTNLNMKLKYRKKTWLCTNGAFTLWNFLQYHFMPTHKRRHYSWCQTFTSKDCSGILTNLILSLYTYQAGQASHVPGHTGHFSSSHWWKSQDSYRCEGLLPSTTPVASRTLHGPSAHPAATSTCAPKDKQLTIFKYSLKTLPF